MIKIHLAPTFDFRPIRAFFVRLLTGFADLRHVFTADFAGRSIPARANVRFVCFWSSLLETPAGE
jgi:hypothetical protein